MKNTQKRILSVENDSKPAGSLKFPYKYSCKGSIYILMLIVIFNKIMLFKFCLIFVVEKIHESAILSLDYF